MHTPDESQRTVRLPLRFKEGKWLLADGSAIPKLADDTLADLVIPAYALLEENDRVRWTAEDRRVMFKEGTSIWARVRGKNGVPIKATGCAERVIWPAEPASVVEIKLQSALVLVLRAGKTGLLDACRCTIPALDLETDSVNEAYTRISEKYETHRRSHSGNVFKCVYYLDGKDLKPLEDRRIHVELEGARESDT